jgi:ferredoxin
MMASAGRGSRTSGQVVFQVAGLDALLATIRERGYRVVGPTVRDGAIVYDEIESTHDLPVGWSDEQDGGRYRLRRRDDGALFGYAVGPHSWKRFLHPPRALQWRASRTDDGFEARAPADGSERFAFIGVRGCELAAIAVQDRVLLEGSCPDPIYRSRRDGALIVAVNCASPASTCFCVSMGTGPGVSSGFDLALTEVMEDDRHEFVAEAGSDRGAELLDAVPHRVGLPDDEAAAERVVSKATSAMGRTLDTGGIHDLLLGNLDHPRWDDVASRCLSCGNCTMVCPTCFCTTTEDVTDLIGDSSERWRRWDSCFTLDFSYLHGGSVRGSTRARYRQWMTHKLATWIDQFGTSGCVGCGRCITWCPVGIDLTEEVAAIRGDGVSG